VNVWDNFLEKLPKVLEKLNQDAYILKNDPASNALKKFI
jgi:serine O-acetyltransferase